LPLVSPSSPMIDKERIQILNERPLKKGRYVLYWMQASQRAHCNHALEYAIERANDQHLPLVVYFGLTDEYPEANERHYRFMLEGLLDAKEALSERGIGFVARRERPERGVVIIAEDASLVVVDRGYTVLQRQWRASAASRCDCPFIQVEGDVVVPVQAASLKQEYSAATLRPKIRERLPYFLHPLEEARVKVSADSLSLEGLDLSDIDALMSSLSCDGAASPVTSFKGGTRQALHRLERFLQERLESYHEERNEPSLDASSNLSPYLHFGHISPLHVALEVSRRQGPGPQAFLEELIIRRELSMNYVFYNGLYNSYEGLPRWARRTLEAHRGDRREWSYTLAELEEGRTHDEYWNAAQHEMIRTGKMQGYMRMYWGKKILEWSPDPEVAFASALLLNNRYELDGRDPNGFVGVAWCFGAHDRPWKERPVFGNIRYMNAAGLRRKFDMEAYMRRIGRQS
jgi:deoxyribodipyrimidine photo-lyase